MKISSGWWLVWVLCTNMFYENLVILKFLGVEVESLHFLWISLKICTGMAEFSRHLLKQTEDKKYSFYIFYKNAFETNLCLRGWKRVFAKPLYFWDVYCFPLFSRHVYIPVAIPDISVIVSWHLYFMSYNLWQYTMKTKQ